MRAARPGLPVAHAVGSLSLHSYRPATPPFARPPALDPCPIRATRGVLRCITAMHVHFDPRGDDLNLVHLNPVRDPPVDSLAGSRLTAASYTPRPRCC